MSYDGLTYTYSNGMKAGMPEDIYLDFKKNETMYFQYNKPIPSWYNIVTEPDNSVVRYRFAYSNPFSYVEKEVITLPEVTPEGVLISPGSGSVVQPFDFSIYTPTEPYVPMDVPTTPDQSNLGAAAIGGLGAWAFLIALRLLKKKKKK